MIKPVILCGGCGSRLWPLSRNLYPKQFLALLGEKTLFQETLARAAGLPGALAPMTVCNLEHRFIVAEQLRGLGLEGEIVLEPAGRNTAPAIAVAALRCEKRDPVLLVLPADHHIEPREDFARAVDQALPLAEEGWLVTFGIDPTRPETGYGYIRGGRPRGGGRHIDAFVEKPDLKRAEAMLAEGGHYWNSGIFVLKPSAYLREMERLQPEMLEACRRAVAASKADLDFIRLDRKAFEACPEDSIDYAVMEKTDKGVVVPMSVRWSDLGSWHALFEAGPKDAHGNVTHGDVHIHDAEGCYLDSRDRLLTAVGVRDLVVVVTADAVLVADKDASPRVKELVAGLRREGRPEVVSHRKVYRPWGAYETTDQADRFKVKRITVNPGQILSLQKHHHRAEHWIVVRGTAAIVNGDTELVLREDQSTYIPIGNVHRLENPGRIPLDIIEVQTGSYLEEDDIVRLDDVYNRLAD
ncbi:MAG: mannose-1-phosphate guanylyltransferase/mannose-6-phosphate isomerase [Thermodesulfobacteriota bacterium]